MKKVVKLLITCGLTTEIILSLAACKSNNESLLTIEAEIEENVLSKIVKAMELNKSRETVYVFDLKYIDTARPFKGALFENGYPYLILSGDIICNHTKGRQRASVSFDISEESYEILQNIKQTSVDSSYDYSKENFAWQLYGENIKLLKDVLNDKQTNLTDVYNHDEKRKLYTITFTLADQASSSESDTNQLEPEV